MQDLFRLKDLSGRDLDHLVVETSFLNGHQVSQHTLGCAKPDVYFQDKGWVFDYKFSQEESERQLLEKEKEAWKKHLPYFSNATAIYASN